MAKLIAHEARIPCMYTSWEKCLSVSGVANKSHRGTFSAVQARTWRVINFMLKVSHEPEYHQSSHTTSCFDRVGVAPIHECSILRWVCLSACHLVVSSNWNCLKFFFTGLNQRNLNNPLTIQHVVNIRLLVNRITAGHSSLLILIVSRSAVAWVHDSFLMVGFRKLFGGHMWSFDAGFTSFDDWFSEIASPGLFAIPNSSVSLQSMWVSLPLLKPWSDHIIDFDQGHSPFISAFLFPQSIL